MDNHKSPYIIRHCKFPVESHREPATIQLILFEMFLKGRKTQLFRSTCAAVIKKWVYRTLKETEALHLKDNCN